MKFKRTFNALAAAAAIPAMMSGAATAHANTPNLDVTWETSPGLITAKVKALAPPEKGKNGGGWCTYKATSWDGKIGKAGIPVVVPFYLSPTNVAAVTLPGIPDPNPDKVWDVFVDCDFSDSAGDPYHWGGGTRY